MTLHSIINQVIYDLFVPLIPILLTLGVIVTFWGGVQYIKVADNPDKRKQAGSILFWGIIGLFVMVSVWGIVNIFVATFPQLNTSGLDPIPLRRNQ
jgi:FtsH-binding integral membrane protein